MSWSSKSLVMSTGFLSQRSIVAERSICIPNQHGESTTPSVVAISNDVEMVGREAVSWKKSSPESVIELILQRFGNESARFSVAGREYMPEEIGAILLRQLARDAASCAGDNRGSHADAVLAIPASFGISQRRQMLAAGERAGLNVLSLVDGPAAASIGYGLDSFRDGITLVFDLGGGNLDLALVEVHNNEVIDAGAANVRQFGRECPWVRAPVGRPAFISNAGLNKTTEVHGKPSLGGREWSMILMDHLVNRFREITGCDSDPGDSLATFDVFVSQAEQAKHALSTLESVCINVVHDGKLAAIEILQAESPDRHNALTAFVYSRCKAHVEVVEDPGLATMNRNVNRVGKHVLGC